MPVRTRSTVAAASLLLVGLWSCGGRPAAEDPRRSAGPSPTPVTPTGAADDAEPADDGFVARTPRSAAVLTALLPSNATGCAPGARCIRVTSSGRPSATGTSVAQCRGEFADFIVPRNTIPASYQGPWFQPNLIEQAHTGIPQGTRPWRGFDPRQESQRLGYLLALRNYAFASQPVRSLTPQLTGDSDYLDAGGGTVPQGQRDQKWYPAPRMVYGSPSAPGTREAAYGMTLERTIGRGELGGNTVGFRNYAVAYYDARGARTYARVWDTSTPGRDEAETSQMRVSANGFVYKLLFSAARPSDFPEDLLAGSLAVDILQNANGPAVHVRLLQIDIAVKDSRADATGWYFATYAYDRGAAGSSWRKMVPVGLTWGNDPDGPPLRESWINPAAPAYARAHLGVEGRLNGPVDNRVSACMSCHSTAQAPSLANMIPPASGPCAPSRPAWFRDLSGSQPFGRFDPEGSACETAVDGVTLVAADYSLQLASTVVRSRPPSAATFNPCTWDEDNPPPAGLAAPPTRAMRTFPITRDPAPQ